jgi:hypothetical protein
MSDGDGSEVPSLPSAKAGCIEDTAGSVIGHAATPKRNLELDVLRNSSAGPSYYGRLSPAPSGQLPCRTRPAPWWSRLRRSFRAFWIRNRGVLLVALSQLFGALMNLTARLLELEGQGMHPFQVLFARQLLTMVCCTVYMYLKQVPGFPLGSKGIRWLLVARGVSGFFGIFGLWQVSSAAVLPPKN